MTDNVALTSGATMPDPFTSVFIRSQAAFLERNKKKFSKRSEPNIGKLPGPPPDRTLGNKSVFAIRTQEVIENNTKRILPPPVTGHLRRRATKLSGQILPAQGVAAAPCSGFVAAPVRCPASPASPLLVGIPAALATRPTGVPPRAAGNPTPPAPRGHSSAITKCDTKSPRTSQYANQAGFSRRIGMSRTMAFSPQSAEWSALCLIR
jgi:hypothetical protein